MDCIRFLIFAGIPLLFSSCSNQDYLSDGKPIAPIEAKFAANISGSDTRAVDNRWDSGDAIGISGGGYDNIKYQVQDATSGKFVAASDKTIYFHSSSDVTFKAYYPFAGAENKSQSVISANTQDQSKSKTFDFLWAEATTNHHSPSVIFNFSHKMSKLVLNLKTDENAGFTASDISNFEFRISGIRHDGTFNTSNGSASATGQPSTESSLEPITSSTSNVKTCSMILFPQESELTVTASSHEMTFKCTFTPELLSGKTSTYDITVKKSGLEVSCSIDKWTEGSSLTGIAIANVYNAVLIREASGTPGSDDYVPALYIADRDVGAAKPEDSGLFFWWGDTEGVYYDSANNALLDKNRNIITHNGSQVSGEAIKSYFSNTNELITTYNKTLTELYANGNGFLTSEAGWSDENADNSNAARLKSDYDAASKYMGDDWHMMTADDIEWLTAQDDNNIYINCDFIPQKEEDDTLIGITIKSKSTGNEVFLPYVGYFNENGHMLPPTNRLYYWSATPSSNYINSYSFYLGESGNNVSTYSKSTYRYMGMPIRAVIKK